MLHDLAYIESSLIYIDASVIVIQILKINKNSDTSNQGTCTEFPESLTHKFRLSVRISEHLDLSTALISVNLRFN